jgi:hypothetical protein
VAERVGGPARAARIERAVDALSTDAHALPALLEDLLTAVR